MSVNADIVAVLTHYGADFVPVNDVYRKMRCPFHEDRNASASVNTDAGKFRCFACDFKGDGLDIIIWKGDAQDFTSAVTFAKDTINAGVAGLQQGRTGSEGVSREARHHRGQRSIFQAGGRKQSRHRA